MVLMLRSVAERIWPVEQEEGGEKWEQRGVDQPLQPSAKIDGGDVASRHRPVRLPRGQSILRDEREHVGDLVIPMRRPIAERVGPVQQEEWREERTQGGVDQREQPRPKL